MRQERRLRQGHPLHLGQADRPGGAAGGGHRQDPAVHELQGGVCSAEGEQETQ